MGQISKATGLDAPSVQSGLNLVGPTVLGGLAKAASTPEGAESLFKAVSSAAPRGDDMFGGLVDRLTAGGTDADMMQTVLGGGVNAIAGTLSKTLGFDLTPLMKLGSPLIAGVLGKIVKDRNLDAKGLSALLADETTNYMNNPANSATSDLVRTALDAGDAAVALRKQYSEADWNKVRIAPVATMYLVSSASPSGVRDTGQEMAAAAGAVAEAIKEVPPTSLIGTAFGGGLTKAELALLSNEAPPRAQILAMISSGLAAVKAYSPSDATAFRNMLIRVATKTAEAAKEGGFLGIGGTRVTAEEEAAIQEISIALT
jgi:hypothetical protein